MIEATLIKSRNSKSLQELQPSFANNNEDSAGKYISQLHMSNQPKFYTFLRIPLRSFAIIQKMTGFLSVQNHFTGRTVLKINTGLC